MLVRAFIAFVLIILAVPVQAQERIALLIGNAAYKPGVGKLVNPLNDIRLVGSALRKVGFEVLEPVKNATRVDILDALDRYTAKLRNAGPDAIGFIYYSGHGIASRGTNYLIPVEVERPSSRLLRAYGLRLNEVLSILRKDAPRAAHYLVIDACRNELQGARGSKGFVAVNQQAGTLIAFATAPGQTASDIGDGGGPYAKALARELVRPGVDDLNMFHRVRVAVRKETDGDQVPWTLDGIQRDRRVMFGGKAPQPPMSEAGQAWRIAQDSDSCKVVGAVAKRFPNTFWADLARERLDLLKCTAVASAATVVRPATPSTASCDGVIVSLASGKSECIKPGSGKGFKDCPTCPEMVVAPAGSFKMGAPRSEPKRGIGEDQVKVSIAKPFAVGKFEVTRAQFAAFIAETKHDFGDKCWVWGGNKWNEEIGRSFRRPGFSQTDDHPVVCVNWNDAKAYIDWLNGKLGQSGNRRYRLPSDAEWEYAARAGTTTPFWWGTSITTRRANYNGNYVYGGKKGKYRRRTVPVDSFKANPWGLYNVHGNVWEWTEDCWNFSNTGNPGDGGARTTGDCSRHVLRGGSWSYYPQYLRAANRFKGRFSSVGRNYNYGFRVVKDLEP